MEPADSSLGPPVKSGNGYRNIKFLPDGHHWSSPARPDSHARWADRRIRDRGRDPPLGGGSLRLDHRSPGDRDPASAGGLARASQGLPSRLGAEAPAIAPDHAAKVLKRELGWVCSTSTGKDPFAAIWHYDRVLQEAARRGDCIVHGKALLLLQTGRTTRPVSSWRRTSRELHLGRSDQVLLGRACQDGGTRRSLAGARPGAFDRAAAGRGETDRLASPSRPSIARLG